MSKRIAILCRCGLITLRACLFVLLFPAGLLLSALSGGPILVAALLLVAAAFDVVLRDLMNEVFSARLG